MEIRLGESIRKFRREAGYTQEQLAEALGVTTGAVHKWESGRATPELERLVDIAEFFETSVDALLDYGWQKMSMGAAADRLAQFTRNKQPDEGIRYAEKMLQKYPNSFRVVWESAELFFLTMSNENGRMQRAVELYRQAIRLFDQNEDPQISLITIHNRIALSFYFMNNFDEAIELLKQHNVEGLNNPTIGLFLSENETRARDALPFLSDALHDSHHRLYEVCIGYANAYGVLGEHEKILELLSWFLEMSRGLRQDHAITYWERTDLVLLVHLTEAALQLEKTEEAQEYLRQIWDTAVRFDANPQYKSGAGMKHYYGSDRAVSYDAFSPNAMEALESYFAQADDSLRLFWQAFRDKQKLNL